MKTLENNKLIAEFMGWGYYFTDNDTEAFERIPNELYTVDELEYNSSWDWLMPVVNKCLNIYHIEQMNDDLNFTFYNAMGNMEETYQAVVEFIQWYNENKN